MAAKVVRTPKTKTTVGGGESLKGAPTVEEIAIRSYELYLERGRIDGHDVEDWLQAESELSR
jgi:hypothetical protein